MTGDREKAPAEPDLSGLKLFDLLRITQREDATEAEKRAAREEMERRYRAKTGPRSG